MWETEIGKIPYVCHIHHIDGDKSNNNLFNLECIYGSTHLSNHSKMNINKLLKNLEAAKENAKDWHRSDDGIEWHRNQMIQQWKNIEYVDKECEVCGKHYTVDKFNVNKSRFCSNRCKSKYRRDNHLDDESRECIICGKEFFTNKYSKAKTCSKQCAYKSRDIAR